MASLTLVSDESPVSKAGLLFLPPCRLLSDTQFAEIPTHSCAPSEYALFDEATCDEMRAKVPRCQQLTKFCYNAPNRFTCVPATLSCWQIAAPFQNSGRNPYDVRKTCDREGEE